MSKLYKFSPIKDKHTLLEAAEYVVKELGILSKQLLSTGEPVGSVKIFAHYAQEYEALKKILYALGEPIFDTYTSSYVRLRDPIASNDQVVSILGVRIPDPYRSQVGCGDFVIDEDYKLFEKKHITNDDPTSLVRKAVGHSLNMIELWHPDFDVLGYVLAPESKWAENS
ncbi:MAG TPA: hypothetical protein VMR76_03495 [Candidatus Saccharimonadia bacterium]|nr:hypothetical protein [Candidatus Saccharimonadia bacterium]